MQNKTKIIFIISAIIIVVAVLFLAGTVKLNKNKTLPDGNDVAASTTEKTVGGVTYSGTGDFKVEQISVNEKTPSAKVPDLNRQLNFPSDMSADVKAIIEKKIADNVTKLKNNPSLVDEWLSLGINRKMINDYEGAREAWEYVTILAPNDPVAFANLSDLYGYYLKDNIQAEKNYLQAIANGPGFPNYYLRAASFYVEVANDLQKAREILIKGLATIPDETNMKNALDRVNVLIANKSNATGL